MDTRTSPTKHAKHSLARRRARRHCERGAALTEAVVSIPFLLLAFAGIMFVGKMYDTKLGVMRKTKESAWDFAMCNCGDSGDSEEKCVASGEGPGAGSGGGSGAANPPGFDSSSISKVGSADGGETATKNFGSSQASLEATITADNFLGGYTKRMSSRTKVMCNEAPHDGTLKGWASAAFDSFRNW